jgi:hypothetical protein
VSGWDGLVATALLGTQRREVDTTGLPDSVRRLAESTGGEDPARALLTAAALLAGYRKAGRLPLREVTPLSVAVPDDRELVPARARRRLLALLTGDRIYLLGEWLSVVAERGLRVPPETLPDLAEAARGRTDLRRSVVAAAGPRGAWLAGFRSEWAFLGDQAAGGPEVWQLGTIGQRHAWLADLRAVEPDRAREALAETWQSEPAPVRVRFLSVLRTGLSTSDERFLEGALDDRAQDVRALAAELLTALPGSALSARMADRLRPLISLRGKVLVVKLPGSCTKAMQRDGLSQKAPRGIGARAWWLGQLVSSAPLSVWAEFGSARELSRMAVEGTDPRLLILGWAAAAVRERDTGWIEALLDGEVTLAMDQVAAMVAVLPRDRWAAAVRRLTRDRLHTGLFQALPAPWPADVGHYVLDRLAAHRDERAVAHVADIAARAVPRECFGHPLLGETFGSEASPWRRRLVDTLIFRRSMYEELS